MEQPENTTKVSESHWHDKAIKIIDLYLARGGPHKGNEPQFLGGSDLLNTIGMALSLDLEDPDNWTREELHNALNGKKTYFTGTARQAIDVIADQIIRVCSGDATNFVTVLPIVMYADETLYELPLFRVHRFWRSHVYYVDNIGRSYDSVSDWRDNNKLPPCKMAYPYELQLQLRPGHTHSHVMIGDSPSAKLESKAVDVADIVATGVGLLGIAASFFLTGGLATPILMAEVASAAWVTGRSTYKLVDRGTHGESVNPFTNSDARNLWLGIAANLFSFGAIGASARLASLAARGEAISHAMRLSVNLINGTSFAFNLAATIEASVYLATHYKQMSTADILLHIVSIAFWTKGLFAFKTAGMIIHETQDSVFASIGKQLSQEQGFGLTNFRTKFNNDEALLAEYHRAAKAGISETAFSEILIDTHTHGVVQFDGAGNLMLPGGHSFSIELLNSLPQPVRAQGFEALSKLTPREAEIFEQLRLAVNNDSRLISFISEVGVHNQVDAHEATQQILNFWDTYTTTSFHGQRQDVELVDGNLILGRAPAIPVSQLPQLSLPMVTFLGDHLSLMDIPTSRQWSSSSINVLLELQTRGMFGHCRVTGISPSGRAVVLLNDQLQISIYKLETISATDCESMFTFVGRLPATVESASLPKNIKELCVQKYRLRLECHRRESVQWMSKLVENIDSLHELVQADLQNYERDRLYTFRNTVSGSKATPYEERMMRFVAEMEPRNISEMVAYGEFVVHSVETQSLLVEQQLRAGELQLPPGKAKKEWRRETASAIVFEHTNALSEKFNGLLSIVRSNNMVGVEQLPRDLSDTDLVAAVKGTNVKFGSEISAAYHIYKHPIDQIETYVTRANEAIAGTSSDMTRVELTQDGDARTISFAHESGSSIVLERDGRVLLCTFIAKRA